MLGVLAWVNQAGHPCFGSHSLCVIEGHCVIMVWVTPTQSGL